MTTTEQNEKTCRVRAAILQPLSPSRCQWIPNGELTYDGQGTIVYCGAWRTRPVRNAVGVQVPPDSIVIPGIIDCHSHLSQYHVRGRGGHALLEWLRNYVFIEEAKFRDGSYARKTARSYFGKLLSRGVTCVALYSNYRQGVLAAFDQAGQAGIRAVIGYTLMDRGVPPALKLKPRTAMEECHKILDLSSKHPQRLTFSLNPRFALACSASFMRDIGRFARDHGLFIQTHLSENLQELSEVRKAFPGIRDYTSVYDRFGLLTEKTLLAHCIHLSERERKIIRDRGCGVVHCPSANMFLHSGRFPIEQWQGYGKLALGSDVGAGPSFSMFDVMRDVYFDNMQSLSQLFYLSTMGGAKALGQESRIGSLEAGKQADFSVLSIREANRLSGDDILSDLIFKHDQRRIEKVFVAGNEIFSA